MDFYFTTNLEKIIGIFISLPLLYIAYLNLFSIFKYLLDLVYYPLKFRLMYVIRYQKFIQYKIPLYIIISNTKYQVFHGKKNYKGFMVLRRDFDVFAGYENVFFINDEGEYRSINPHNNRIHSVRKMPIEDAICYKLEHEGGSTS